MDVRRRHRDQLGVRAVAVLADHVDRAVAGLDAGVDHDRPAGLEAVDACADRLDDAGAVRPENPRLRNRGQTFPDPDVEVVER